MTFNKKIFLFIFPLVAFFILGLFSIYKGDSFLLSLFFSQQKPLLSPLAEFGKEELIKEPFQKWQAKGVIKNSLSPPAVEAKAVLVLDYKGQKIIYEKNAQSIMPIASLTKIMTALVGLERKNLNEVFKISPQATTAGEAAVGFQAGQNLSLKDLLYGALLVSGNDAAETLAENIGGIRGKSRFVALMNQKAFTLGLSKTSFINPTGLDEEQGVNLSSAFDLAALTFYTFGKYPILLTIFKTQEYSIEADESHPRFFLINTIQEFTNNYPYIVGGKTANTDAAGFCLMSLAKKEDKEILVILLGEPTFAKIKEDSWKIFEYGFSVLGATPSPTLF